MGRSGGITGTTSVSICSSLCRVQNREYRGESMEFFDPLNTETDRYSALFDHWFDSMSVYEDKIGIRGFTR